MRQKCLTNIKGISTYVIDVNSVLLVGMRSACFAYPFISVNDTFYKTLEMKKPYDRI